MKLHFTLMVPLIFFTISLTQCGQKSSYQTDYKNTSLTSCASGKFTADFVVNVRDDEGAVVNKISQGSPVILSGDSKTMSVNGTDYEFCKTAENLWVAKDYLSPDLHIDPTTVQGDYTDDNTYIHVNLSTQMITVRQAGTIILEESVSTGKPGYQTCTGTFKIRLRYRDQTMRSPFPEEPYSIYTEFVQYFDGAMAFHSATHNSFGKNISHGCVNMRKNSAELLWNYYNESKKHGIDPRVVIEGVSPNVTHQCAH